MTDHISYKPWIKRGNMLINAESLDIDDPDHIYNQIKSQGGIPEDYGFHHPLAEEFKGKTRGELIQEIVRLRKDLEAALRWL